MSFHVRPVTIGHVDIIYTVTNDDDKLALKVEGTSDDMSSLQIEFWN